MDINDLRTLATVLVAVAFAGISWWAFGPSRKKYFDDAAQLPFADDNNSADDEIGTDNKSNKAATTPAKNAEAEHNQGDKK
jgi:cytochrome c oxidase cbb3-type subunit 4